MAVHKFTRKYTIIQLFDDIKEGYEFSSNNWPLHATIIDTFAISWSVDKTIFELTKLLKNHEIAASVAKDDVYFGVNGEVPVTLLDRTDSVVKLHYEVLNTLKKGDLMLNEPLYARDGFLPHSTIQPHARLQKDDVVRFTALSIVDMFPDKDPFRRRVLKTIKIGA